jgi:glycosyltransferase involved in cell wall biosynthesis
MALRDFSFPDGLPPEPAKPVLKVLFFYPDFGQTGGIEKMLVQMARQFRQRGTIEPVFVCSAGGALERELLAQGVRVYGVLTSPWFRPSMARTFDFPTWFRLSRIVAEEKPDIAHVHAGLVENLWFRRWGIPVVYTFHGYGTLYSTRPPAGQTFSLPKRVVKWVIRQLFCAMASRLDALLFVSRAEHARMQDEGYLPGELPPTLTLPREGGGDLIPSPALNDDGHRQAHLERAVGERASAKSPLEGRSNVAVLTNGIPLAEICQQAEDEGAKARLKAELGLSPHARCITFVNRLDANKNPMHFLTLAQRLAAEASVDTSSGELVFLLVGDGELRAEVEAEAQTIPNVHVLGYRTDVPALLGLSDLLVYPSRREGFGLGLVEAMAIGVPCVAYASEGALDVLDTDQYPVLASCLVPVDDENVLYERVSHMLRLLANEREPLRQALRQRVAVFDSESFIVRQEEVYRTLSPFVSIILPVFQGEKTILSAVQSVLRQSYPHFELLIINDGSTDGTAACLQTITDPRVRVFHRDNAGVAASRNFAFTQAKGDYIAFVDADDRWLPNKLAEEMAVLRRHASPGEAPVCLVYSGYFAIDETDRLIHCPPARQQSGDLSQAVLEDEGIFLPSTTLVHRDVFSAVGGFPSGCHHEDRAFFITACQQFPAYPTGQPLTLYRQSMEGRCRAVLKNFDEALTAELSIAATVQPILCAQAHAYLEQLQLRNLLYRFLMYNRLDHSRRLYHQFFDGNAPLCALIQGKKGSLSRLALKTGVNFPFLARLIVQNLYRHVMSPFWSKQSPIRQTF